LSGGNLWGILQKFILPGGALKGDKPVKVFQEVGFNPKRNSEWVIKKPLLRGAEKN